MKKLLLTMAVTLAASSQAQDSSLRWALLEPKSGTTVLMVLHDINQTIRYADNVVMMKHGKILATGSAEEVITEERLREVYGVNAKLAAVQDKKICIFE